MNNKTLKKCGIKNGYYRDGYCTPDRNGNHIVCAKMTTRFLNYAAKRGNNLYSVTSPDKKWCICKYWWDKSHREGYSPTLIPDATHSTFNK